MSPKMNMIAIAVVAAVIVASMSVFAVDEREHALKLRFGEILRADYEPGLHFKLPVIHAVSKFPDRILTYEDQEEKFLTGEKKNLIVDYFVTYRIIDPSQYYRAVRGDEARARQRLSAIVKEGIKAAFASRTVREVVSAERSELMDQMIVDARGRSPELGIELVDVRVKRIDLSDEVSNSVYSRMQQERERTAKQLRAEGDGEAARIEAEADRQRTIILAEAYRESERIRGEGDQRAAEIYAAAFSQDSEFYSFYRSMQAYRQSIGSERDMLVLEPDSEFFRYLQRRYEAEPLEAPLASEAPSVEQPVASN